MSRLILENIRELMVRQGCVETRFNIDVEDGSGIRQIISMSPDLRIIGNIYLRNSNLRGYIFHPLELAQLVDFKYDDYFRFGKIKFIAMNGTQIELADGRFYRGWS